MSNLTGEEIVISGISGIFPDAGNVHQLSEKLFNKVDLINKKNKHSGIKHSELPPFTGRFEGLEKFDAKFFRVTPKQAVCLDPAVGKLMEQTFSALFDAGINPETLKGSKIGVYIAATQLDSVNLFYHDINDNPFRICGASKTMFANRISYWIDGKGPSYSFDNGWAGSMAALEQAYKAMKNGEIDCAVVGGSNYCIIPELTLNMKRAGLLCLDGKTKCFDKNGDGFVRSDAINVYFLQKAKDAKRIYSEVYHVKGKYFASPDGLFSPTRDPQDIEKFLDEFYSEVDVSPADVEYIEANSFGIAKSDENELQAIGNVFAKDKTIKIGSVKSNLGNTEAASGACSVTKMCLAYQKGQIPANLHFNAPQNHINAVKEKKLQVVTENLPFSRNFTAINNFCYTGTNFHTLLKGHYKPKDTKRYKSSIPRLVLVSGRLEEDVNKMLDILETDPIDAELLALLNNFFKHYVPGYTGRGYTILDSNENNETVSLSRGFEFYSGNTRPIWFLFSGMGSQWAGMGEDLLRIPVFASAIDKCQKVLLPKGLDIIKVITDKDDGIFTILTSIVAITAIQIGLCDVMASLGIVPDKVIGHSVGEIACAYVDGCLTAEETILASYYRGLAAYEAKLIPGKMAAVGLGQEEVAKLCPPEVDIACHNSSTSTTISGPTDIVTEFVQRLTDQGIFAKEVNSYNISFHSRYIAEAGPRMLGLLKEVITNPKPRSKKWFSTCYPPEQWNKTECKYVSAEYLVHNLLGAVLFEEAAKFIPDDALILEIAPHGLLQAIMKRSHKECLNLSLTRRGESDGAKFLLKTIGNLYQIGINPDLELLYPKVEFPVATDTSTLSHYVGWDYSIKWEDYNIKYEDESAGAKEFTISIYDDDSAYFKDYIRYGVNMLPEAALLVFVWETLANLKNMNHKDMSVKFQDIKIHKQIILKQEDIIRLEIAIQKGTNKFEVFFKNSVVVEGLIDDLDDKNTKQYEKIYFHDNEKHLTQNDIYLIMRSRGYSYVGDFQSIISSNMKLNKASLKWNEQWITFLDSIIQLKALSNDHDGVSGVKHITELTINTDEHKYGLITKNGTNYYNALILKDIGVTRCGGVIFHDLIYNAIPKIEIVPDIFKILKINVPGYGNSGHNTYNNMSFSRKNNSQRVVLIAKESNNIESLAWTEASVISNRAIIQVSYSGLSMKDCKKLSSSDNQYFGLDFSGYDRNGNKVMGILARGALASTVEADHDLLWPVPHHWSLAEAATVPLPFVHAFYCLKIISPVAKKSNIFIAGAAGALGQAAICIALSLGCTIFGTVANNEKKRFLLKLFPELDEKNIGYTYDDTFPAMVIEKTNSERCSVVISTGSGKIREAAMSCVGFSGNFLDVNDNDQNDNKNNMPMSFLKAARNYISVNMSTIFAEKYSKYKKVLHTMVSEGIAKGFVRPLTNVVFSPVDVIKAFKMISIRNNRGRVLINTSELAMSNQGLVPRISLHPNKSYIVLWDGSELGVELIDLLIKRGARRLLIHCVPKLLNGFFQFKYSAWNKAGATIEFNSDDLQINDKCQSLISKTESKLGLLDGIFITWNDFEKTNKISYEKKENIEIIVSDFDIASRKCKHLRYFGVVTAISQDLVSENILEEIESCCSHRNVMRLPSLFLRNSVKDKTLHQKSVAALFNVLETSLTHKYISVCTSHITDNEIAKNEENITRAKLNTDFESGLLAFYRHISKDEIIGTEPIVPMKTQLSSGCRPDLMLDPDDPHILLIPGFEGNSESLTSLSERLKKQAIGLQLDPNYNKSIPDIAKHLLKYVKERIHIKSPFHLMGYSFGVNVALEMAALLEKEGLLGVVYCLDSSPDALRVHLDAYLGILTDEQLQNCLIEHIYTLLVGDKSDELNKKLIETTEWSEKVEIFISNVKTDVHLTHEYMRSLLQAAYDRIKMAKEYEPKFKLDSEIVLLKGIPHPEARKLSDDYNLSVYTDKPVTVLDIESDHAMAQFDCRVSNYINRFFVL